MVFNGSLKIKNNNWLLYIQQKTQNPFCKTNSMNLVMSSLVSWGTVKPQWTLTRERRTMLKLFKMYSQLCKWFTYFTSGNISKVVELCIIRRKIWHNKIIKFGFHMNFISNKINSSQRVWQIYKFWLFKVIGTICIRTYMFSNLQELFNSHTFKSTKWPFLLHIYHKCC